MFGLGVRRTSNILEPAIFGLCAQHLGYARNADPAIFARGTAKPNLEPAIPLHAESSRGRLGWESRAGDTSMRPLVREALFRLGDRRA
jgi:hypothetical protein